MKELLENMAKALVEYPNDVNVEVEETQTGMVLKLHVNESDMGKVIGKQGRIAKAIRIVIKAAAIHENIRVSVEIL
ncbi:MAG: KH domain-containing protein [Bacillota bacterium]|nr:KH domain-containing protein [Bacillota bacterium]